MYRARHVKWRPQVKLKKAVMQEAQRRSASARGIEDFPGTWRSEVCIVNIACLFKMCRWRSSLSEFYCCRGEQAWVFMQFFVMVSGLNFGGYDWTRFPQRAKHYQIVIVLKMHTFGMGWGTPKPSRAEQITRRSHPLEIPRGKISWIFLYAKDLHCHMMRFQASTTYRIDYLRL